MPPEKRDPALLLDMVEAGSAACRKLQGVELDRYLADEDLQAIVERRLITLGEAANLISQTLKKAHPQIPWAELIKQRHIFVHVYNRINNRRTWQFVVQELPQIVGNLRPLLPALPPKEST
jgi:uncharacterized protein with HEPN domain